MSTIDEADSRFTRWRALQDELEAIETALLSTPDPYQEVLEFSRGTVLDSMPELWGKILLTFGNEHAVLEKTCEIYSTWLRFAEPTATISLQATCSRPLAHTLFDEERTLPTGRAHHPPARVAFRETLDLNLPTEPFLPLFSADPAISPFSQLEQVTLRGLLLWGDFNGTRTLQWPGDISTFCECPNLRAIEFKIDLPVIDDVIARVGVEPVEEGYTGLVNREADGESEEPTAPLLLPWRTLRSLRLSQTPRPLDFWYEALAQCRHLEIMLSWLRVPALNTTLVLQAHFTVAAALDLPSRSEKFSLLTFILTCHISTCDAYSSPHSPS
uniref:F-box domain-containing protein n=1 Tax=Mycena chlorophos TaxID=658473 RepID=A0ABQ0KXY2_MYCCL|nr:predicted protein [Mycena chlorophos]